MGNQMSTDTQCGEQDSWVLFYRDEGERGNNLLTMAYHKHNPIRIMLHPQCGFTLPDDMPQPTHPTGTKYFADGFIVSILEGCVFEIRQHRCQTTPNCKNFQLKNC